MISHSASFSMAERPAVEAAAVAAPATPGDHGGASTLDEWRDKYVPVVCKFFKKVPQTVKRKKVAAVKVWRVSHAGLLSNVFTLTSRVHDHLAHGLLCRGLDGVC